MAQYSVTFEPALISWLARKGFAAVEVKAINPVGCCCDMVEVLAVGVKPSELDRVRARAGRVLRQTEALTEGAEPLELLITSRELEFDPIVTVRLGSFLGIKDIRVDGIVPFRL